MNVELLGLEVPGGLGDGVLPAAQDGPLAEKGVLMGLHVHVGVVEQVDADVAVEAAINVPDDRLVLEALAERHDETPGGYLVPKAGRKVKIASPLKNTYYHLLSCFLEFHNM
jgi:hypothetical protein